MRLVRPELPLTQGRLPAGSRLAIGSGPTTMGKPVDVGPAELLIVLAIALLLFGSTKLPKLARSMGQASKEFRKGVEEGAGDGGEDAHD